MKYQVYQDKLIHVIHKAEKTIIAISLINTNASQA